jgi:hypothetical protein
VAALVALALLARAISRAQAVRARANAGEQATLLLSKPLITRV